MTIKLPLRRQLGLYCSDDYSFCGSGLRRFIGPIEAEYILLCASNEEHPGMPYTFGIEWCNECSQYHFTWDSFAQYIPYSCDHLVASLTDPTRLVDGGTVDLYVWIETLDHIDSYEPIKIP